MTRVRVSCGGLRDLITIDPQMVGSPYNKDPNKVPENEPAPGLAQRLLFPKGVDHVQHHQVGILFETGQG